MYCSKYLPSYVSKCTQGQEQSFSVFINNKSYLPRKVEISYIQQENAEKEKEHPSNCFPYVLIHI